MVCGTCGCDNPERLVFCQECGQRLGARVAPPTPAIVTRAPTDAVRTPLAIPASPRCSRCGTENQSGVRYCMTCGNSLLVTAAPAEAQPPAPAPVAIPPAAAPVRAEAAPLPVPVPIPVAVPAVAPARSVAVALPNAKPPNAKPPDAKPADAKPADAKPAAKPAASSTAPLLPAQGGAPPRPAPATGPVIAPAAVYQVGKAASAGPTPAPTAVRQITGATPVARGDGTRSCPRCHGTSDDLAQFCRFCGAPMGLGPPVPARVEVATSKAEPAATARPVPAVRPPAVSNPQVAAFWRPPTAPTAGASATAEPAPSPTPLEVPTPHGIATPLIPAAVEAEEARRTAPPAEPIAAPTPPTYGRIVIVTKEGGDGASFPLGDQLDIGRLEGEVLIADDRYLSPRHARIARRGGAGEAVEFVLVDLESTNGIYLRLGRDGTRDGSREVVLEDQDLFLVGQQVLKFSVVRDAEEGLAPATEHGTLVFGTPIVPRYARLSQRTVEGVTRDVFHVQKAETVLGRESGDIVFTDDPFLSRRHAAVKFEHGARRFVLTDLGSSNGTFIQIRGQVTIKSGDQFRIGQQLFRVDLTAPPAP